MLDAPILVARLTVVIAGAYVTFGALKMFLVIWGLRDPPDAGEPPRPFWAFVVFFVGIALFGLSAALPVIISAP
jgi:hypothetical protein